MSFSISRFRTSTQIIHNQAKEIYKQNSSGRKTLGVTKTATLMKGDNHTCSVVKEDAQEKARRRIYGTYLRAMISYYLDCKTSRGRTEYTGENSTCGGCQGSHWSLTPTLCDDKIFRIIEEIIVKGLTPKKTKILRNTLKLSKEQEENLKKNHANESYVKQFFYTFTADSLHRIFHGTHFAYQNNSTIENPISSNAIDSRFECKIRKVEDENCDLCTDKKIEPEEGTLKVVQASISYFKGAVEDLTHRKEDLEEFIKLNNTIQSFIQKHPSLQKETIQSDSLIRAEFLNFFKNIQELLNLREKLQVKVDGAKTFKKVNEYRRDYHWLTTLLKQYQKVFVSSFNEHDHKHIEVLSQLSSFYSLTQPNLKEIPNVDFSADVSEFDRYILEAGYQLELLKKYDDIDMIKALKTLFFGIFEKDLNTRREPNDEEITWQLINMTKKIDAPLTPNSSPEKSPGKVVSLPLTTNSTVERKAPTKRSLSSALDLEHKKLKTGKIEESLTT